MLGAENTVTKYNFYQILKHNFLTRPANQLLKYVFSKLSTSFLLKPLMFLKLFNSSGNALYKLITCEVKLFRPQVEVFTVDFIKFPLFLVLYIRGAFKC